MENKDRPVGFFDSGVGGISVLRAALQLFPKENFIYYGDSKNAPYGEKRVNEVRDLSFHGVDFLLNKGVKAVVVACNTATSAAIEDLREYYKDIPIIGIEPALKPAVELRKSGSIIIMATPMTLAENKFNILMKSFEGDADIIPIPCGGLAELIENGVLRGPKLDEYLQEKLFFVKKKEIAAIVLGCTHYPFISKEIGNLVGENIPIIDGAMGTVKQLKRQLFLRNLASERSKGGLVEIHISSGNKQTLELSRELLYL